MGMKKVLMVCDKDIGSANSIINGGILENEQNTKW